MMDPGTESGGGSIRHHLAAEAFLVLRNRFFRPDGAPVQFPLREKRNTQDDPLDEYLSTVLEEGLGDAECLKSPGPLITPDLVLLRLGLCTTASRQELKASPEKILALEVKKLERTTQGGVARASGLDYNTTPPCGTVRIYDNALGPVDIPGFYLFVCLEWARSSGDALISSMVMCDGNVLNDDFDLYKSIVGQRSKVIGLGTYGDGANRVRPMLIFANPLGAAELDRHASLILSSSAEPGHPNLAPVYRITRTKSESAGGGEAEFVCFREKTDVPEGHAVTLLADPFPIPRRQTTTRGRGRFVLPFACYSATPE